MQNTELGKKFWDSSNNNRCGMHQTRKGQFMKKMIQLAICLAMLLTTASVLAQLAPKPTPEEEVVALRQQLADSQKQLAQSQLAIEKLSTLVLQPGQPAPEKPKALAPTAPPPPPAQKGVNVAGLGLSEEQLAQVAEYLRHNPATSLPPDVQGDPQADRPGAYAAIDSQGGVVASVWSPLGADGPVRADLSVDRSAEVAPPGSPGRNPQRRGQQGQNVVNNSGTVNTLNLTGCSNFTVDMVGGNRIKYPPNLPLRGERRVVQDVGTPCDDVEDVGMYQSAMVAPRTYTVGLRGGLRPVLRYQEHAVVRAIQDNALRRAYYSGY